MRSFVLLLTTSLIALVIPVACVDSLDLTLRQRVNVIVVDGTITNLNEPQVIRLNRSKSDSLTGRFGSQPLTDVRVDILVDSIQCMSSTKGGQMRVKREEILLNALYTLENMTFPPLGHR